MPELPPGATEEALDAAAAVVSFLVEKFDTPADGVVAVLAALALLHRSSPKGFKEDIERNIRYLSAAMEESRRREEAVS